MEELSKELAALEAKSQRRRLRVVDEVLPGGKVRVAGQVRLNLSSNDYLGLSQDPRIIAAAQAAAAQSGAGAGASRLVVGHLALHEAVEARLADFKGAEAAVIFPTGYMANVGTISALVGPGDVIFSDRLNHASIYDGIKLSGAALQRFPHRDLNRLEQLLREAGAARRRLIVTDSVFSVDGDLAPLKDLVALKARYGAWLMCDEAHATGVLGAKGGGLAEALGLRREVDIHLGTLFQGVGLPGGLRGRGPASGGLPPQPGPVLHLLHRPGPNGAGGHRPGVDDCGAGAGAAAVSPAGIRGVSPQFSGRRAGYPGE